MAQKKDTQDKKSKMKDLPPKKDAKGGGGARVLGAGTADGGVHQAGGVHQSGGVHQAGGNSASGGRQI